MWLFIGVLATKHAAAGKANKIRERNGTITDTGSNHKEGNCGYFCIQGQSGVQISTRFSDNVKVRPNLPCPPQGTPR